MPQGLLGKKLGMTRLFSPTGEALPVTVLEVGPCYVIQKRTAEKDGYEALQLGYEALPERKVNKPLSGHFQAAGRGGFRHLKEFRGPDASEFELGQELTVEIFKVGQKVHVTSTSKGRGFAGATKRHGFSRGPETHGCTTHRAPGSIGTSATPSHVLKGKKMPGHMGAKKTTVKNLKVVDIRPGDNLLLVKGAVPGAKNARVIIRKSDSI